MADAAPAAPPGASPAPADAFASGEFDAVAFINKLFPDESSLSGVDALVAKLRLRVRRVDDEILEAVRSQSAGGRRAKEDLAEARGAVFELASRIAEIKAKAERSESMVEDICKDVRRLDRAKRHLTGTITALRRLSMLVSAVEQLEQMAPRRQYRDSANLLEAVNELSAHFDGHADVPKIEKLQKQVADVSRSLRDAAFEDFHSTFQPTVIEQDPGAAARLADACLVVNALEPHVREELVGRVANGELTNYASVFDAGETERSGLENVERRYAWIKRNVRSKEQMWAVFPPEWRVAQLVCMSLCKLTRTHILEVLDATTRSRDVHATLRALHRTVEFEREMDEHFGVRLDGRVLDEETTGETGDEEEEEAGMSGLSAGEVRARYAKAAREKELAKKRGGRALPMDSAAAALAKASFKGVISTVFEDHMDAYVELEERQLLELVDALANEETWGAAESSSESSASATGGTPGMTSGAGAAEKNASSGSASASDASDPGARSAGDPSVSSSSSSAAPTLPSAARLFLHIKKVFRRCSNLTRGKPLLALHGAFVRVARANAGRLVDRAEASGRFLVDVKVKRDPARIADEYRALCLILNTAEYCGSTLGPLKATVRRALRDEAALRDAMDGGPGPGASRGAEDDFAGVTTAALATLVEGVEHRTELIPGVKATNWAALEAVGDQSAHVNACEAALRLAAPTIRASTEATFHAYFCEKLAGTLAPKLYRAALDRRQKFSDAGAQQFLLDAHAVRTMLVDLPSMGTGGGGARDSGGGGGGGAYARLVAREMGAVEALLKIVLSPREGLAETFEALLPKASLSDFLAVCELKGMTKPEAARAAEGLRGRGAAESPRGARGGAGAGAEKNADASAADPSPPPPPPPPPPRAASSAKPPEPLAAARAAHHARTGSGSAAGSAASSDARGRHARTGSGGGVFGGATMPNMPSVNFGAMFKPGSGSSINQMMEKAKEATQKAASGMKEMGEKAADETRKLGKRAGM